jgi:hypothetical protein
MSSLKGRLFLILVAATSLIWLAATCWIDVGATREIESVLDARLQEAARMVLSLASGNGVGAMNFQLLADKNLDANEGPLDFDKRHNFVFSGSWSVPRTHGLTLGMVTRYLSGDHFTIQDTNFDVDQNGILLNPLPAGKYSGTGNNSITVHNDGGRNGATGPDFFQMDARVGYRLPVSSSNIELFADMFNVTNRANFANPSGDKRSTNFLVLTALRTGAIPRTIQIGGRLIF